MNAYDKIRDEIMKVLTRMSLRNLRVVLAFAKGLDKPLQ